MNRIYVIGSGFSSLSAACYLAQAGYEVVVLEKNDQLGGRARQMQRDGFRFDMGPTWYWMPDVFEKFFNDFGKKSSDYYRLHKLGPAYEVYFGKGDSIKIADNLEAIYETFESEEAGSAEVLRKFLKQAESNYNIAIKDLVYNPGLSPLELVNVETISRLGLVFSSIQTQIRKRFKNPKLIQILEFPVLFLGAKPSNTPALYNFMNWADFGLGTWHPEGGMVQVVHAMVDLARELGVEFRTQSEVQEIRIENGKVSGIRLNSEVLPADMILSGADYHHTEKLLAPEYRQYSEKYWEKKTFAPSSLLFYVGFDKKVKNVTHHTLFFDADFQKHAEDIYDEPKWPKDPLFYTSFPSITDASFAPEGKEAATFLIPIAPDLEDTAELREHYFDIIMNRLEYLTDQNIKESIIFKESYCVRDFVEDYHSYKGNAYGMANTLLQTAFLRPKLKSKKVKNLYFTGQLTVPGPGVPPSIISGKIVSDLIKT